MSYLLHTILHPINRLGSSEIRGVSLKFVACCLLHKEANGTGNMQHSRKSLQISKNHCFLITSHKLGHCGTSFKSWLTQMGRKA